MSLKPDMDHGLIFRFAHSAYDPESKTAERLMRAEEVACAGNRVGWDIIEGMPVVYSALKMIAAVQNSHPHTASVTSAYLIGGPVLTAWQDYSSENYRFNPEVVFKALNRQDPERFRTVEDVPEAFVNRPHHNTYVRTVGMVTKPDASEGELERCLVVPGNIRDGMFVPKVKGIKSRKVTNPFYLDTSKKVAVHRDVVIASLDKPWAKILKKHGFPK